MAEKKKTSKKTADSGKRRKQQPVEKRVIEPSPVRTRATKKSSATPNVRRDNDNPRVSLPNPRRVQKQSRAYTIFIGSIFILLGAALFLMLFTFTSADLAGDAEALNIFGVIGAYIANIMLTLFGLAAFLFSALSLLMGICTISGKQFEVHPSEFVGLCILLLGASPLLDMGFGEREILDHLAGGVFGHWIAEYGLSHLPKWGVVTSGVVLSIFGGLLVTDTRVKSFFLGIWKILRWAGKTLGTALAEPFRKPAYAPALPEEESSEAVHEHSSEFSESIFYEDSPSELLNGKTSKLEEREAQAMAATPECFAAELETGAESSEIEEASSQSSEAEQEEPVSVDQIESAVEVVSEESDAVLTEKSSDESEVPEAARTSDSVRGNQENIGDFLGRLLNPAPKKRPIKESKSVPAMEPEFDFNSILSPEQLSRREFTSASSSEIEETEQPAKTSVLSNWKPRSIGRKTFASADMAKTGVVSDSGDATIALSDVTDEVARKAIMIPAPELPTHMTKDLLVQLATEEIELEDTTRIGEKSATVGGLDDTADMKPRLRIDDNDRITVRPAEPRPRPIRQDDAFSPEMRALMDGCGFDPKVGFDPKKKAQSLMSKRGSEGETSIRPAVNLKSSETVVKDADLLNDSDSTAEKMPAAKVKGRDIISKATNVSVKKQTPNSENATKYPVSPISMDESEDEDDDWDSVDDEDDKGLEILQRLNAAPVKKAPVVPASDMPTSFVVAEEKKRVSEAELQRAEQARIKKMGGEIEYHHPPLSLLQYDPSTQKGFDHESLRHYASKIEEKLAEYHIQGQVVQICPGPIITRFEFQPAPGTKVARIQSLSDDLMMALEIASIRILAPIPGKGVVGIEIPNEKRNTIYLKEIIGSKQFIDAKSILTIALGKDSEGEPVVSDLAKMPHLLVAGSTGSGKSVAINTMICSLLYNATPDEVKFILVDPKCLELSIYEGIPHLLVPPITTPKETAAALDWACDEMDERYRKLAAFGVRNIAGYNEQLKNPTLPKAQEAVLQKDEDGEPKYKPMPYIVIVVDEFADLMMTSGKEIEKSIARLAQKARAAGIHIILATQRPSTNVITGVIKANFPTRIAFRVFSYVDSRTILDTKGAEALLGMGDSLFLPPNTGILQRVHGAYVSDEEVQSIVSFLSSQRKPEYNLDITTPKDDEDMCDDVSSVGSSTDFDPLYDQAVQIVAETRQASASFLQRKLSIGFNRAARIVEQMEREGVVGPQRGQKPREVFIEPI